MSPHITPELARLGVTTADKIMRPPTRAELAAMIKRAEREQWLEGHALYAWGPVEPVVLRPGANTTATPMKFETTADPVAAFRRWEGKLWVDVKPLLVAWVVPADGGDGIEESWRLKATIDAALDAHGFPIRNGWWDITIEAAWRMVAHAARVAEIRVETDEERARRLEVMAKAALMEAKRASDG